MADALQQRVVAMFADRPQQMAAAKIALESAAGAVQTLRSMGVECYVALGAAPRAEWPKNMYHAHSAAKPREVWSQIEWTSLWQQGWRATPQDAQQARGLERQMAGRGGIPQTGLPVPTDGIITGESLRDRLVSE
ncbi:MAG: hypothetical protein ABFE07_27035, partial [Armatimonadia bacterium]